MENRFASIWNHVNEGIFISDKSGKIVLVNPRCADLFGYWEDEMLDRKSGVWGNRGKCGGGRRGEQRGSAEE